MAVLVIMYLILVVLPLHENTYVFVDLRLSKSDAEHKCSEIGGKFPTPSSGSENSELKAYLEEKNISTTWLGARFEFNLPWRLGSLHVPASDQGCYDSSSIQTSNTRASRSECISTCRNSDYIFAAIQDSRRRRNDRCRCINTVPTLTRISENQCDRRCGRYMCGKYVRRQTDSFRLLSTLQAGTVYKGISWSSSQSGIAQHLCASSFANEYDRVTLRQEMCNNRYRSVCCNNKSGEMVTLPCFTWFEAYHNCSREGGYIVSHNQNCSAGHNTNFIGTHVRFWTDLRAWDLHVEGKSTNESKYSYTNWDVNQPDFRNECVELQVDDGTWKTADCRESKSFICETDKEQGFTTHHAVTSTAQVMSRSDMVVSENVASSTLTYVSTTLLVQEDMSQFPEQTFTTHDAVTSTAQATSRSDMTDTENVAADTLAYVSPTLMVQEDISQFPVKSVAVASSVGVMIIILALVAVLGIWLRKRQQSQENPAFINSAYEATDDTFKNAYNNTITKTTTNTQMDQKQDYKTLKDCAAVTVKENSVYWRDDQVQLKEPSYCKLQEGTDEATEYSEIYSDAKMHQRGLCYNEDGEFINVDNTLYNDSNEDASGAPIDVVENELYEMTTDT